MHSNISMLQMRAFLAVSRFGSFTLAAEALHRTQPAITVQVRQLEDSLGLKLIDRTTRQFRLTAAGIDLAGVFATVLQQLDAVVEATQDRRAKRSGIVRIGCLPTVAANYLPQRIAYFRVEHPGISFLLNDALGDRVISLVKSGDVDFGITDAGAGDDLEMTLLLEEKMCALFLEGHALETAAPLDVAELGKHDLILMAHGSNARRLVDTAFATVGRPALATCEASYMSTAVGMVRAGLGVALLPLGGVNLELDSRLRVKTIDAPGFSRQIALVRLKSRTLSPAAAAFLDALVADAEAKKSHH